MRSFRCHIIALVALLVSVNLSAQEYLFPIRNVAGHYSASYGEMRPNHFHSGVDIRTDKVEGKPVVAVADGYVSRVSVAPGGYGLALYIAHPDKGTMSVYAHLSRLRRDIADYLTEERYKSRSNSKNLFPAADMFRVNRGDTIAFSGNSGSSFGPHLHFEMRDTKSGYTLNPVKLGVVSPQDTIPPPILRLHYVLFDSVANRVKSRLVGSYTPSLVEGEYRLPASVKVWGKGYFVLETLDKRNGSSNRFGIYGAKMSIDGAEVLDFKMDRFSFADTRHCNVVSYFPLQRKANCEVVTLAKMPYAPSYLYHKASGRAFVSLETGVSADVVVQVEDECGNSSALRFTMVGTECKYEPKSAPESAVLVDGNTLAEVVGDGFSLFVPKGALYEPEYCHTEAVEPKAIKDSTLVELSRFYRIFAEQTPMNKAVRVVIAADVPIELQRHACVATVDEKGKIRYLGGEYRRDSVEVATRRGGNMVVVADTVPPKIVPRFSADADMRGVSTMKFSLKDNFSGIGSYTLMIDGEWRTLDYQPIKGELVHRFDRPLNGRGVYHPVVLEVNDKCGNRAVWQGRILK